MAALFGNGSRQVLRQQAKELDKRERELRQQQLLQAKLLAARRRIIARGTRSKTIVDQILGSTNAVKKKTLGEGNI